MASNVLAGPPFVDQGKPIHHFISSLPLDSSYLHFFIMDLLAQRCGHLPEGTPALQGDSLRAYLEAVDSRWRVEDGQQIVADFTFADFAQALTFTNQVGALAEDHDHHPEITLTWGRVTVKIWTHTVGGVSPNDFILAAHIDTLLHA